MTLTHRKADLAFAIIRAFSGAFPHHQTRQRVGRWLLDLWDADH